MAFEKSQCSPVGVKEEPSSSSSTSIVRLVMMYHHIISQCLYEQ